MPRLPFSIRINDGEQVTMKSLRMVLQSLDLNNMQTDTASLMWARKSLSESCPISFDDVVEIYLGTRRLFHGRARLGEVDWQGTPVTILGAWNELETRVWNVGLDGTDGPLLGQQITVSPAGQYWNGTAWVDWPDSITWTYATSGNYTMGATTGTLDVSWYLTSRMWLFAPVGGNYRTVAQQLSLLLNNVLHVTAPDVIQIGTIALGNNASPKVRTIQDISIAEAVRQTLTVKPDAAVWFDYEAAGVPAIQVRVASLENETLMRVGRGNGQVLPGYRLTVKDDLIPAGVVIRWETEASQFTGMGLPFLVDKYPANITSYQPRVMVQTVGENIPRVAGLAQEIYTSLAVRRTAGSLSVLDVDFSQGLRPGRVLPLEGDAMLDGVQNLVQTVRWDPATGIAACSVGYPQHLGLQERIDLRGWLRKVFYVPGALVSQIMPPPA